MRCEHENYDIIKIKRDLFTCEIIYRRIKYHEGSRVYYIKYIIVMKFARRASAAHGDSGYFILISGFYSRTVCSPGLSARSK